MTELDTSGPLTEPQAVVKLAELFSQEEKGSPESPEGVDEDLPEGESYAEPEQAEPEDAPAAPEEEAESEEQEEPEAPAPPPRKIKVRPNGIESEVTEEEAAAGYMRTDDYTRKSQVNAKELAEVRAERAKYAADFGHIETILKSQLGTEPDWDTLRATDPIGYAQAYADYDRKAKTIASVQAEKARADAVVAEDNIKAHNAMISEESKKLPLLIPAWKDEKVRSADMTAIATYVKQQGWTDQELRNVTDARLIAVVNKARLYDAAQANKPKIQRQISGVTRSAAPGTAAPTGTTARANTDKAIQKAAKTGDPRDVAAAMARLLGG